MSAFTYRATFKICDKVYNLHEGHNTIGRNQKAKVNIRNLKISNIHAIITIDGNSYSLSDFDSTNGTFYKNQRIIPYKINQISDNDEIVFGDLVGTFCLNNNENVEVPAINTQNETHSYYNLNTQTICENHMENDHLYFQSASTHLKKQLDNNNMNTYDLHEASTQICILNEIHDELTQVVDVGALSTSSKNTIMSIQNISEETNSDTEDELDLVENDKNLELLSKGIVQIEKSDLSKDLKPEFEIQFDKSSLNEKDSDSDTDDDVDVCKKEDKIKHIEDNVDQITITSLEAQKEKKSLTIISIENNDLIIPKQKEGNQNSNLKIDVSSPTIIDQTLDEIPETQYSIYYRTLQKEQLQLDLGEISIIKENENDELIINESVSIIENSVQELNESKEFTNTNKNLIQSENKKLCLEIKNCNNVKNICNKYENFTQNNDISSNIEIRNEKILKDTKETQDMSLTQDENPLLINTTEDNYIQSTQEIIPKDGSHLVCKKNDTKFGKSDYDFLQPTQALSEAHNEKERCSVEERFEKIFSTEAKLCPKKKDFELNKTISEKNYLIELSESSEILSKSNSGNKTVDAEPKDIFLKPKAGRDRENDNKDGISLTQRVFEQVGNLFGSDLTIETDHLNIVSPIKATQELKDVLTDSLIELSESPEILSKNNSGNKIVDAEARDIFLKPKAGRDREKDNNDGISLTQRVFEQVGNLFGNDLTIETVHLHNLSPIKATQELKDVLTGDSVIENFILKKPCKEVKTIADNNEKLSVFYKPINNEQELLRYEEASSRGKRKRIKQTEFSELSHKPAVRNTKYKEVEDENKTILHGVTLRSNRTFNDSKQLSTTLVGRKTKKRKGNSMDKEDVDIILPPKLPKHELKKKKIIEKNTTEKKKEILVNKSWKSEDNNQDDKVKKPIPSRSTRSKSSRNCIIAEEPTTSKENKRKISEASTSKLDESSFSILNRSKRVIKPKVVFSMMDDSELESAIRQMGGLIVDSVDQSTVLITKSIKRTTKVLCAVAQGKPICDPLWILESKRRTSFLDPWNYILKDDEAELKWGFSLREAIERGGKEKLLNDYTFQIMINSGVDAIKGAIIACGGKCVTRALHNAKTSHLMIVSTENKKEMFDKIIKKNSRIQVIEAEAIFDGTLRQQFNFSQHIINV